MNRIARVVAPRPLTALQRGAALMMVLVILGLLLVMAVSFAFLMTQQEGTSVASLAGDETRIVTRTAADHAYARLNRGNRLREFERWWNTRPPDVTAWNDPWLDSFDESTVDLLYDFEGGGENWPPNFSGLMDNQGRPLFRVEDPRRLVLGVNVQDESGKVNLNACSPALLGNILGAATLTEFVQPQGGTYPVVTLTDANFLTPYDEDSNPTDNRYGPGFVVLDGCLFSYTSRVGNQLFNVIPNAPHNGMPTNSGEATLFAYWPPDRPLPRGMYATTPTAYKVVYRRFLATATGDAQADANPPARYNNLGEVRRIAELRRWFNLSGALGPYVEGIKLEGWPEGLDPVHYQHLERLATTGAPTDRFDGGWFFPYTVQGAQLVMHPELNKDYFAVSYDSMQAFQANFHVPGDPRSPNPNQMDYTRAPYGAGNIMRFRHADGRAFYAYNFGPSFGMTVNAERLINQGEPWIVECAERATVNINTAPLEVVEAVFHGIGPRGRGEEDYPITRQQARRIALAVRARIRGATADPQPFRDLGDLEQFLRELHERDPSVITRPQINHFVNTQRFPYSQHPLSTAQFSFHSLDYYMVDAFATRYQPSGGVMARRAFREWASIGSDSSVEYIWRAYQKWQEEMRLPQGNVFNLFPAGTENGRMVGVQELPFIHYLPDERHMRGRFDAPWSSPTPRDMYAMGVDAPPPRREKFYSNVVPKDMPNGQTVDVGDLEAGMFSLWYRPQWEGHDQNHHIFDCAEQPYSNRIGLLWWGQRQRGYRLSQRNSGLVLRVKDRTLEEAFTELRMELDPSNFRTRDWYHLNMNWKGTSLSHLNLLLDGDCESGTPPRRPEINHTFRQSNNAWVSRTSTLDMELEDPRFINRTQFEIYVDQADIGAFPQRGVILIGDEAIEYNGNNGVALLNAYRGPPVPNGMPGSARGARGTTAHYHPRGSRVTVFGYVSPVRQHFMNNTNPNQPQFPRLPATSGNLRSPMGDQGLYRVSKVGSANPIYYRPQEYGPDAGFPGGGDDQRGGDPYHLPLADYTGLQQRGVVAVYGFAWRGYHPPGTPGIPQAGVWYPDFDPTVPGVERALTFPADLKFEYVAYDRIDPQGLHVMQRYDASFTPKDPATWFHFLGTYGTNLPEIPYNPAIQQSVNIYNFFSAGTCVVPVSIDLDNVTGYHSRSCVQVDDEWFFYNRVWDPQARPTTDLLTLLICLDGAGTVGMVGAAAIQDNKNPPPSAGFRGYYGTGVGVHPSGVPVTPCFGSSIRTGEQDVVTTINGKNNDKELHRIRRQRHIGNGPDNVPGTYDDICIAALYDHTSHTYDPNQTYQQGNGNLNPYNSGNLCKFPTGELPVELPVNWTFAGTDPRAPEATVNTADFDSFELRMYTKGDFRLVGGMTDSQPGEGGEIQVNQVAALPRPGVVKIDDELICYRMTETRQQQIILPNGTTQTIITYWLTDITRGILGTQRTAHTAGTPIMNMASLRIGQSNASGSLQSNQITAILGEESMRPYGFIRIIDNNQTEIAGYQKYLETVTPDPNDPNRQIRTARMTSGLYRDPAQPQALFRGVYGTQARPYGTRALFFDQPVRFPDFFPGYHERPANFFGPWHQQGDQGIPGARSPEISYIQGALTLRNTRFEQFQWIVAWPPHAEQSRYQYGLGARLVVRFRGRGVNGRVPDWGEVPTNRPGGLYSFEFDFGGPNTRLRGGIYPESFVQTENLGGVRADGIEWRVYFYYKQNAFTNDLYKATLQFQGASVTATQYTDILRHEEKR
ncbi:MAG: hypothetical protein HS108_01095 [Planctomycetes bacterium]|nr:hypothetical protein [Planctomycetota bacterium]MCL4729180.1 hypothetical protein [Planctomycetota bacterium]